VVAGWVAGDSAGFEDAGVDVGFAGEEDAPAAGVVLLAGPGGGVPEVAGDVAVSGGEEPVPVGFVLTDKQDPGGLAAVEKAVAPPSSKAQAGSEK